MGKAMVDSDVVRDAGRAASRGRRRSALPAGRVRAAEAVALQSIRAVFFDLDNCLSAAHEVGRELYAPAFSAIRQANAGCLSEAALRQAFADAWRNAFDRVAAKYHFSSSMYAAGCAEFARLEVSQRLHGYPDLPLLARIPYDRYLITSGFRRLQESKIRALGIADAFRAIHIDAIDSAEHAGKRRVFQDIMAQQGLQAGEVLVVGDNPESELAAGHSLGMRTVQIMRPWVTRASDVDGHIRNLNDLLELLRRPALSGDGSAAARCGVI